jgi:hypothetical protein
VPAQLACGCPLLACARRAGVRFEALRSFEADFRAGAFSFEAVFLALAPAARPLRAPRTLDGADVGDLAMSCPLDEAKQKLWVGDPGTRY